jgi:hypothetical protein
MRSAAKPNGRIQLPDLFGIDQAQIGFATDLDAARTRGHHRTGLPQNAGRPIGDGRQHLKRRCVVILSPFEGQAQQQFDTTGSGFGFCEWQGFFIALHRMMVRHQCVDGAVGQCGSQRLAIGLLTQRR